MTGTRIIAWTLAAVSACGSSVSAAGFGILGVAGYQIDSRRCQVTIKAEKVINETAELSGDIELRLLAGQTGT